MSVDRMSRFERFIGTWNTRGEVLATDAGPGTLLLATDTYRWGPGRGIVVHDVDARFGETPTRSMEIIAWDAARRRHTARSWDDRGTTETFDVELRGRRWRIIGETARFDGGFTPSGDRLAGLWELRGRRGRWQPWIHLELVRA